MFELISYISLGVVLAGIILHCLASPPRKGRGAKAVDQFPAGKSRWWCFWEKDLSPLGKVKKLAGCLAIVGFVGLFLTGFGPRLITGEALHGYLLMLHATLAPIFIVCVAFAVLVWAWQCRLEKEDLRRLAELLRGKFGGDAGHSNLGWKLSFWIAALLALPVSLSMVVGMYPIFGTHGQETLLKLHQFSSLALTLVVMLHLYLVYRAQARAGD